MMNMAVESSFWGLRVGSRDKWNWICPVRHVGECEAKRFLFNLEGANG